MIDSKTQSVMASYHGEREVGKRDKERERETESIIIGPNGLKPKLKVRVWRSWQL